MEPFLHHKGKILPIDRANIDTDAILPKQFMKSIKRSGFGDYLFDEWRYLDHGEPGVDCTKRKINPDFALNKKEYKDASILLTRENFGCGSSREHAPWAIKDFGIKVLISPSFASIFYTNCLKNGLLPLTLATQEIERLFHIAQSKEGCELSVSLPDQTIKVNDGRILDFTIDDVIKRNLMLGQDEIALTLAHRTEIIRYECKRKKLEPWLNIKPKNILDNPDDHPDYK